MLETALVIIAIIAISHYLITNYRKKESLSSKILVSNQVVRPDKPKLLPFIRALISQGQS